MREKDVKGFTLIALVITVIILLILAGITIITLTGENGILIKTINTKEESQIKSAEEKLKLAIMEYQVKMKEETLQSIIKKIEGFEKIEPDDENSKLPYIVTIDGYDFLINEDLSIEYLKEKNSTQEETITGSMINGQAVITVNAKVEEGSINAIQLYDEKDTIIFEKDYTDNKKQKREQFIQDIPFYSENKYYAIIKGSNMQEEKTANIQINNYEYIRTEEDIRKLAEVVNNGTSFEGKQEIKQVLDINLTQNHIAIGNQDNPFKGVYNGQEKKINNLVINNSNNFQGLFGVIEGATIKNLILEEGRLQAGNRIGAIVRIC